MQEVLKPGDLKGLLEAGNRVQVIDVRSAAEFEEGHIPTAVNIPVEQIESRIDDLDARRTAVLVCHSGQRSEMCQNLLAGKRQDLTTLDGGTEAWIEAGLPVVRTSTMRLPLMRQVQIGAGSLALAGAALGYFVDPRWGFLAMFIGGGLLTAGLTGFCGMAKLLAMMPWNRPAKTS